MKELWYSDNFCGNTTYVGSSQRQTVALLRLHCATLKMGCYIKTINELLYFDPQWNCHRFNAAMELPQWNCWKRTPPQKLSDNPTFLRKFLEFRTYF
jgi:hypothetical protein